MTLNLSSLDLPDSQLISDQAQLKQLSADAYTEAITDVALPLALVRAGSVSDIQTTLKFANQFHVPVVTRGAGTSIVNGSAGQAGSIILDVSRLNQILEINIPNQYAVVQPGVLNEQLDQAARQQGYFFSPDPGSKRISSVGGNIATNAGGMSSLKYGTTKQSVISLKVVLADGRLITVGGKTFKNNAPYDLTDLFVGSEGTLGVIVEATVKLLPIPFGSPVTGLATFADMRQLSVGVQKISASGLYPSMMEALNQTSIIALDRLERSDLGKGNAQALLIFQLDVAPAGAVAALKQVLTDAQALHVDVTDDQDYAKQIIKIRQDYYEAEAAYGRLIVEDVAVPLSKLPDLAAFIEKLHFPDNVTAFLGGHAGDGNFHPNFAVPKSSPETPDAVNEAINQIFKYVQSIGGTVSAEHGIGDLKKQWVLPQLGDDLVALQKRVKQAFDPNGILNPGRKV